MAKQKGKKRFTTVRIGIGPTQERRLQNGGVVGELIDRDAAGKALIKRYKAVWECPLDMYRDTKLISHHEHKAGIEFKDAYCSAVINRRAANERLYNELPASAPTRSERRLKEAYEVLPPGELGLVIDVCAHDQRIWNPNALEKLRKGLGHLALRWNMAAIEVGEHRSKSVQD